MKRGILCAIAVGVAVLPTAALAHPGLHSESSFMSGFVHPLTGLDHILAMISVGLLAAYLGGRSLLAVPAAFILAMIVGGMLTASGVHLPIVESGIAASVVVLGILVAIRANISSLLASAIVAVFGLFHGAAHAGEMPIDASLMGYTGGFVIATALLHTAGIAMALALGTVSSRYSENFLRLGGSSVAIAGVVLMAPSL